MSDIEEDPFADNENDPFGETKNEDDVEEKKKPRKRKTDNDAPDAKKRRGNPSQGAITLAPEINPREGALYAKTLNMNDLDLPLKSIVDIPDCTRVHIRFSSPGLEMLAKNNSCNFMFHSFFHKDWFQPDYRCESVVEQWVAHKKIKDFANKVNSWDCVEFAFQEKDAGFNQRGIYANGLHRYSVGGTGAGLVVLPAIEEATDPELITKSTSCHVMINSEKMLGTMKQAVTGSTEAVQMVIKNSQLVFIGLEGGVIGSKGICEINQSDRNFEQSFIFPLKYMQLIGKNFGKTKSDVHLSFDPQNPTEIKVTHYFDQREPRSHMTMWLAVLNGFD